MSLYIDDAQRRKIHQLRASFRWRSEWPTWLLIVALYGGWISTALNARVIGMGLTTGILAVLSCLYLSLQHELLHGHPTRFPWLNALFGIAPLAVWFPYAVYRDAHLRHHDDVHLTDPELDPESYFVSAERWRGAGPVVRALLIIRNTFFGRIVLAPLFSIVETLVSAAIQIARGDLRIARTWALHLVLLGLLVTWLDSRCGISPVVFIFGVGYPALALSAVRSFQEHRAADSVSERTVINEAAWGWRLLFLNNNFHSVHHDLPAVPWFALPAIYHGDREAYWLRNGGFVVSGYREWMMQHVVKPVAPALHPLHSLADKRADQTDLAPRVTGTAASTKMSGDFAQPV
jgi:fatty acid desaturase